MGTGGRLAWRNSELAGGSPGVYKAYARSPPEVQPPPHSLASKRSEEMTTEVRGSTQ